MKALKYAIACICAGSLLVSTVAPCGLVTTVWAEGAQETQVQQPEGDSTGSADSSEESASQSQEEPAEAPSSAEKKEETKGSDKEKPSKKSPATEKAEKVAAEKSSTAKANAKAKAKTEKEKIYQGKIKKSEDALSSASSAAGKISTYEAEIEAAEAKFDAANHKTSALRKRIKKLKAQLKKVEKRQQRAQAVLDAVNDEMATSPSADLVSVLSGEASFDDIDSRDYLLGIVADDQSEALEKLGKKRANLEEEVAALEKKVAKGAKTTGISEGNEAAVSLEKCLSGVREKDAKAVSCLKDAGSSEAVKKAREAAKAAKSAHRAVLQEAYEKLGNWYELVDSISGVDVAISYGVGNDFSLSEKKFVKKWGTAIDKFYEQYSSVAGFVPPLHGQGETMAKIAYEYKVDPRLCAATSIIESSGGKYCIKPYNAWGWGAADSDPYGGASGWSGWEEAIRAWHEGMTTSTTGLATARCIDELAATYCSSPSWSAHVAEQMSKISALA